METEILNIKCPCRLKMSLGGTKEEACNLGFGILILIDKKTSKGIERPLPIFHLQPMLFFLSDCMRTCTRLATQLQPSRCDKTKINKLSLPSYCLLFLGPFPPAFLVPFLGVVFIETLVSRGMQEAMI